MWRKIKNSFEKWEEKKTSKQLKSIVKIEAVLWVILFLMSPYLILIDKDLITNITSSMVIIMIFIIFYTAFLADRKEEQEKNEEKKICEKKHLQEIFNGKRKIEVRLKNNVYPYYTEDLYKDLGNLVFLHMLTFVYEKEKIKFYAELGDYDQLYLAMILDESDKLSGTKVFDEFPYELFVKYFEV